MDKDANEPTMVDLTGATSAPNESIASVTCSVINKENINPTPKTTHLINHKGFIYTKKGAGKNIFYIIAGTTVEVRTHNVALL